MAGRSSRLAGTLIGAAIAAVLFAFVVAAAKPAEHEALGLGKDLRLSGGRLNGGALVHDDRLVHLCVFRDASRDDDRGRRRDERGDGNDWTGWRPGRMTSASRRNR